MNETWKSLKGIVENGDNYEVSTYGRVRNFITGRVLKPGSLRKGYQGVRLSKDGTTKNYTVHRLVALAFIPNPEGKPEVNHINGNEKNNNRVDNLEWVTSAENKRHAISTGLNPTRYGEKVNGAKLTEKQVIEIKKLLAAGAKQREIAEKFNVSRESISRIQKGIVWSHVEVAGFTPFKRSPEGAKGNSRISEDDVRTIRKLHSTGKYSYQSLARIYGVSDKNISMLVRRVTWKHVD